jgi:hypothetical protein
MSGTSRAGYTLSANAVSTTSNDPTTNMWTFGYLANGGALLTSTAFFDTYTSNFVGAGFGAWYESSLGLGNNGVFLNTTSSTLSNYGGWGITVAPNGVVLDPGSADANAYSVVRWTAPTTTTTKYFASITLTDAQTGGYGAIAFIVQGAANCLTSEYGSTILNGGSFTYNGSFTVTSTADNYLSVTVKGVNSDGTTNQNGNCTAVTMTVVNYSSALSVSAITNTGTTNLLLGGKTSTSATLKNTGDAGGDWINYSGALSGTGTLAAGSSTTITGTYTGSAYGTQTISGTITGSFQTINDGTTVPSATATGSTLNVGYATPTGTGGYSNSTSTFGTALTGSVAAGDSLVGLASKVNSNSMFNTLATILYGSSSVAGTVSEAWRNRTLAETPSGGGLVSDVVNVTLPATTATNYALQLSYAPAALGATQATSLRLVQYTGGGTGLTNWTVVKSGTYTAGAYNATTTVGNWGIDTTNNNVWGVVSQSAATQYAIVVGPLPTLTLNSTTTKAYVGSSFAMTATLSNSSSAYDTYDFNSITSTGANTATAATQSGSVAIGGSTGISVTGSANGTAGSNATYTLKALDSYGTYANSGAVSVALYDHALASLSSTTYDYGNVLMGATLTTASTTLSNASGTYRAGLSITSLGGLSGNSSMLSAGSSTVLAAAAVSTASYGSYNKTYTIGLSDDTSISGGTTSTATYTVTANIGNATANASGLGKGTYGAALTASVTTGGSYDGLASKVTGTTAGSLASLGTQATILYGTNTSASSQTVSMAWRTRTAAEAAATNATPLVSDVVSVSGMTTSGSQSSPFLLEMTFDPNNLKYGKNSLSTCIANDNIYIVSNGGGQWENTVLENTGGTAHYMGLSDPNALSISDTNLSNYLGDYGVWTSASGDYAWAVVNHNSEFAVIPEPSTLGLLVAGFLSLIAYAWRKRK